MTHIHQLYNEWLSLQPLKPEDKNRLDRKFMLEFNYNSNHIEGNTLTYGQTELLLLFGKVVDEANMKDLEEMKAHNVCLKMIQEEAADKNLPLTETFIRQLHHTLYNPQIQISAESETKRSIFREKDKTKRSKKESAQHSKSRNKSFVMTSVSAL